MKRLLITVAAGVLFAGCAQTDGGKSQARLIETYWKAIELEGKPVEVKAGVREPHMVLRSDKNAVNGFSGCNSFHGSYENAGTGLRFNGVAVTRMACLDTAADLENRFLSAINTTATQKISGETLELQDSSGKLRARFESRYMK